MQILINEMKHWMIEAGERLKTALAQEVLEIDTKSSRTDLVTNLDKQTQEFLVERILAFDETANILAEENGKHALESLDGRVYVIDPIDGTMNFVLEGENFCIMVGIYDDGQPVLGFIYNVMKEEFLWGGPSIGVYLNQDRVKIPTIPSLSAGLIGMNCVMYSKNVYHMQEIGHRSMGVRMSGCAGVELAHMALGRRVAYISNLSPWDYAAGGAILAALGMKMSNLNGESLNFKDREYFLAAPAAIYDEILEIALNPEK